MLSGTLVAMEKLANAKIKNANNKTPFFIKINKKRTIKTFPNKLSKN